VSEPMYDDSTLEWIADEERKELIGQLWQYVLALEDYVIRLRNQVNTLSVSPEPYPDPASDFSLRFYDHPAYLEFSEVLRDDEPKWKIPDRL
jgi:hypothetical protein